MAAIIFANCAVLDGTRKERREDHHVLVEGDRIREVSDAPIKSGSAQTIDLKGRTLMPGLIDAHVHVLAVNLPLDRLSDRPVTLLTLQAAKVLEGCCSAALRPSAMPGVRMAGSPKRSRKASSVGPASSLRVAPLVRPVGMATPDRARN